MGILGWQDFMMAVHVRTWTVNEPRKAVPVSLLRRAIAAVDRSSFEEVQLVVLIILLLFTFSRSECPLPKTQSSFTLEENASVADVRVLTWEGRLTVQMRLKTIKQDPRMQRPEASGNDDWLVVGDIADDPEFSVAAWIRRLFSFHGSARVTVTFSAVEAGDYEGADPEDALMALKLSGLASEDGREEPGPADQHPARGRHALVARLVDVALPDRERGHRARRTRAHRPQSTIWLKCQVPTLSEET